MKRRQASVCHTAVANSREPRPARKHTVVLSLLALVVVLVTTGRATSPAEGTNNTPVLAIVNGDTIRAEQLERELMRIHMMQTEETQRRDFSVQRLVRKLVNDRLLVQEAQAIELDRDAEVTAAVQKYRENLAYRALQTEAFPDTFTASEEQIRHIFDRDYERFEIRLLCTTDSALSSALADSIRNGAPMDELARRYSVDKFKDKGGEAGTYTLLGLPPDVRERLRASRVGDLIGPVFIWRLQVLLRVEGRLPADSMRLDSLRSMIAQQAERESREAARREFADRVQAKYQVVMDSALVDSFLSRLMSGEPASDRPILRINGVPRLTETELRSKYTHRIAGQRLREPKSLLQEVLQELTEAALIRTAASDSSYLYQPRFDDQTKAFQDSILIDRYLAEVVASRIVVTDEEIAEYYNRNRASFREAGQYRVATLTRDSLAEAEEDYLVLRSGTDFAWLVSRHSTDDARERGGVRDWLPSHAFPLEVSQRLDTMSIGDLIPPFKTQSGFTVIKLLERKPGEIQSLDDVRERIRSTLLQTRQLQAIDRTLAALREHADIKINEDVIKELRVEGELDAGPQGKNEDTEKP